MSRKRRRNGSSTRKKHNVTVSKKSSREDKEKAILLKLEKQLLSNKDSIGKPLSNDDINKIKVRQANIEHRLGITHG